MRGSLFYPTVDGQLFVIKPDGVYRRTGKAWRKLATERND